MNNTIQNSQDTNPDNKAHKTASILKKVYWGLWGLYGVFAIYISIFSSITNLSQSRLPTAYWGMLIILGVLPTIYGYFTYKEFKENISLLGYVTLLSIIIHTALSFILSFILSFKNTVGFGITTHSLVGFLGAFNGLKLSIGTALLGFVVSLIILRTLKNRLL